MMVGNLPCILFILHSSFAFDFQGVLHDTIYMFHIGKIIY